MAELYVNDPGTFLANPMLIGDTSLVVTSATGFPTGGNFRIKIENELMMVTAVSGTTWTVTRGIETTTAVAHGLVPVHAVVTAGALSTIITQNNLLEQHTANNTATTMSFTSWYSAAYDFYQLVFVNLLPAANNIALNINFSTNGGTSYDSSALYDLTGAYWYITGSATLALASQTSFQISSNESNSANYGLSGVYNLYSPGAAIYKMIEGEHITYNASVTNIIRVNQGCVYRNTAVVNAFQISTSSGNLASGSVRVYGWSH